MVIITFAPVVVTKPRVKPTVGWSVFLGLESDVPLPYRVACVPPFNQHESANHCVQR